ncbi:MAG: hypothetical protein K0Q87_204 [Neobacillus sp.]|jgi:hypothetical protein|nr:hypothetical protein [Neobacillus sp.]
MKELKLNDKKVAIRFSTSIRVIRAKVKIISFDKALTLRENAQKNPLKLRAPKV